MSNKPQNEPADELSLFKLLVIGFGALWICEKIHEGIPPFGGFPFTAMAGYEHRWTPPLVAWLATYLVLYLRRKLRAPLESGFNKLAAFESGFAHRMVGAVPHSAAPAATAEVPHTDAALPGMPAVPGVPHA